MGFLSEMKEDQIRMERQQNSKIEINELTILLAEACKDLEEGKQPSLKLHNWYVKYKSQQG